MFKTSLGLNIIVAPHVCQLRCRSIKFFKEKTGKGNVVFGKWNVYGEFLLQQTITKVHGRQGASTPIWVGNWKLYLFPIISERNLFMGGQFNKFKL